MRITKIENKLVFENETKDSPEDVAFAKRMTEEGFSFTVNGSTVLAHDKDHQLLAVFNPFDNTQFVCHPGGYTVANEFAGKRFIVGAARQSILNDPDRKESLNIISYERDMSFPLASRSDEPKLAYQVIDLPGLQKRFRSNLPKLYALLRDLFNDCADFTPAKQDEYLNKEIQDKYCRFNTDDENSADYFNNHLFLIDDADNIIGTISMKIIGNMAGGNEPLDIYFYDEIVNYRLVAKKAGASADLETIRQQLLAQLFSAVRVKLQENIASLDNRIEKGNVHAFIRAASGREQKYRDLGCVYTGTTFVIHGHATRLSLMDGFLKEWAKEKLQAMQPKRGDSSSLQYPSGRENEIEAVAAHVTFNL